MLKPKYASLYTNLAVQLGAVSQCNRLKVGAFIVEVVDGIPSIIADGVNGLPSGASNCCEDNNGKTLDDVRHAEVAALSKVDKDRVRNCAIVVSDSPCPDCAQAIVEAGIRYVYYARKYRKPEGIEILESQGIYVEQVPLPVSDFPKSKSFTEAKPIKLDDAITSTLAAISKRINK